MIPNNLHTKLAKGMPKILKALLAISILLLAAVYLSSIGKQDQPAQFFIGARNQPPTQKPQNKIFQITNPELTNLPGRWAMAVKNLKSDETYLLRADEKFPAASLYKLAVMWKAYEALEKNQLTPDEILSADKITLDKIVEGKQDKETPETPQETVSLTVENALRAAITVSDNYSAILLAQKLGWENIDSLMEKEGLKDIDLIKEDAPTVTAIAVMDLLERIWRGTAVSAHASGEMKTLLFNQKINDRIPKYLPADVKVGHKTGELGNLRHDAGIILGKKSHYIFVFLSETPAPEEAAETIAKLSQKIYAALEKQ